MVFPSVSHSLLLSLSFHHVFFSPLPRCPAKATDHQSPQRATLIAGVFDITCQNRPHCLIPATRPPPLPPQHLFCAILQRQIPPWCPEAFSPYEWQMQTVRWVARLPSQPSRFYPHLNPRSSPRFEIRSCFSHWSCAWRPTLTRLIRNYVALELNIAGYINK